MTKEEAKVALESLDNMEPREIYRLILKILIEHIVLKGRK